MSLKSCKVEEMYSEDVPDYIKNISSPRRKRHFDSLLKKASKVILQLMSCHRGEQWSFFGSDVIQWFFPARNIGINGFSMVLLPFDHHH